jgi:hypothetical protein
LSLLLLFSLFIGAMLLLLNLIILVHNVFVPVIVVIDADAAVFVIVVIAHNFFFVQKLQAAFNKSAVHIIHALVNLLLIPLPSSVQFLYI